MRAQKMCIYIYSLVFARLGGGGPPLVILQVACNMRACMFYVLCYYERTCAHMQKCK